MKKQVDLALEIATKAHDGQFRKDGVTPYITHPIMVAEIVKENASYKYSYFGEISLSDIISAAYLHDVIEDCNITLKQLKQKGISEEIVSIVDLLTHYKKDSYLTYILRIKTTYGNIGKAAKIIKLADIKHNSETSSGNQLAKYQLAKYILEN